MVPILWMEAEEEKIADLFGQSHVFALVITTREGMKEKSCTLYREYPFPGVWGATPASQDVGKYTIHHFKLVPTTESILNN